MDRSKALPLMAAFVGLLFGHPNASFATPTYLLDTGPGPDNVDISQTPSALMSVDQWLGFRFDTGNSVRIGGVEGWMSVIPGGEGYGRLALYEDSNNSPGTLLYSAAYFGAVTDPTGLYSNADWLGALDLDWKLKQGSYWITFEADPQSDGLVAGFLLGSPNPVSNEVYRPCCLGAAWVNDSLAMGVRVTKRVPEPGTLALFGLGLAGLAFLRRRRAN